MKQTELKKIMEEVMERTEYYDQFKDQVVLPNATEVRPYQTYFNTLNTLFTSEAFLDDNNADIIRNRRICLVNIFSERVRFLMDEKILLITNYLEQYGIICNVTADTIRKVDYRLFELETYERYINNPRSAADCALVINSIIFNNVMDFKELSSTTNDLSYDDIFNITTNILNIALFDLVHMFNTIYLEANEIYFRAGMLKEEQSEQHIEVLEGEERNKALIEMGREDLIESDVKIGRI